MYRRERDEWASGGARIDDPARHQQIRAEFERHGEDALIVVKRWHLNGSTGPTMAAFTTLVEYEAYLREVSPGDALDVWSA